MLTSLVDVKRFAGVAALALCSVACSSYGIEKPKAPVLHAFAPIPDEFARICVIRNNQYFGRMVTVPTWDNDVLVGATKGGTYFCYRAEPGKHVIRMKTDDGDSRIELAAVKGKSHYLRVEMPWHLFKTIPEGTFVAEPDAREAIEDSTYEVVTKAPANEPLPPDQILVKAAAN